MSHTEILSEQHFSKLIGWLEPLFARSVPTLGLCYGHQLLAHLTGGEVGFLHAADEAGVHAKELGLRTIRLAADPLWGEAQEVQMLVSHREAVVRTLIQRGAPVDLRARAAISR